MPEWVGPFAMLAGVALPVWHPRTSYTRSPRGHMWPTGRPTHKGALHGPTHGGPFISGSVLPAHGTRLRERIRLINWTCRPRPAGHFWAKDLFGPIALKNSKKIYEKIEEKTSKQTNKQIYKMRQHVIWDKYWALVVATSLKCSISWKEKEYKACSKLQKNKKN